MFSVGGSCVAAVADLRCSLLCRRLALRCDSLRVLQINMDSDTSEKVLEGLLNAELVTSRTNMKLYVPGR